MAQKPNRRTFRKGFTRTATLVEQQIRRAGESRGFAVSRLLTHWSEIVGADMAAVARPVNISYARRSMGATLTLLTTGSNAPMLEMQKETLRDRVNACYGYQAISSIRLTQTAPVGFSEGAAQFGANAPRPTPQPNPEVVAEARHSAAPVADAELRAALERLGTNVLGRAKQS